MTFDDGILVIYEKENGAQKGDKPFYLLKEKCQYHFSFETLGFNRYYTAKKADDLLECVVMIYQDRTITSSNIAVIDGKQYEIVLAQHLVDDGIKVTRLNLQNVGVEYEYFEN